MLNFYDDDGIVAGLYECSDFFFKKKLFIV